MHLLLLLLLLVISVVIIFRNSGLVLYVDDRMWLRLLNWSIW